MKLASAGTVALLAMLTTGCTVGLELGDIKGPTNGEEARNINVRDGGYFRLVAEPEISNRQNIVECRNFLDRWFSRSAESTILVAINNTVGIPAITVGVNDATNICNTGSAIPPRFALLRLPQDGRPTPYSVSAESEKKGDLKVGQIFTDVGTFALAAGAIVGAGPTSGLSTVPAIAGELQPNIRSEVTNILKTRHSQGYNIDAASLRQNQTRTFNIVTDEEPSKPVGTVRVSTEFLPSLFSSMASPAGTTNFGELRANDILEYPLEMQNNKSIRASVVAKFSNFLVRLTLAESTQDKTHYREVCNNLNDYAQDNNLIRRDSVILRWAFLSTLPRFTEQGFLPKECFNEGAGGDVTLLRNMGFKTLPGN